MRCVAPGLSLQLAAEQRIRQAQAQHWPTISVQAGRTRYENDQSNYWDDQVQLVVDAPLYQGGADPALARGCGRRGSGKALRLRLKRASWT